MADETRSDEAQKAARILSGLGASKGGKARWANKTEAERRAYGAMLAEARKAARQQRESAFIEGKKADVNETRNDGGHPDKG